MLIKYIGGSTHKTISLNRTERFYFTKDNEYTLDLTPRVVNHIIRTEPAGYFELIEGENSSEESQELKLKYDETIKKNEELEKTIDDLNNKLEKLKSKKYK